MTLRTVATNSLDVVTQIVTGRFFKYLYLVRGRVNGGSDRRKWSIDKLDGSIWMTWKFQMRHLLLAKGLWGVVDGMEVLRGDATAQAQAEFQSKSQKVFSTIVMAISSSQLYLITSVEQPKDAWDALRNHFECDTLANKLMLKKQYWR